MQDKEKINVHYEKWIDAYRNEEVEALQRELEDLDLDIDMDEGLDETPPAFGQQIKTIMTPWGFMPLTEHSLASKHFDFWVGHTNFKLWDGYDRLIANVLGVEAVDILTPYRFRIAIGKMFKGSEVMYSVTNVLREVASNES